MSSGSPSREDCDAVEIRVQALEAEMLRQRERSHKLVDTVQVQEGRVARLEWEVDEVKKDLAGVATAEQLRNLTEAMDPIRRGVYGVVWLVVAAVLVAILTLVVQGGG